MSVIYLYINENSGTTRGVMINKLDLQTIVIEFYSH